MPVLSGATASGRQMYQGQPSTTVGVLYTAPAATSNVTSPSATAYVKEIVISNTTSTTANITLYVGGMATANAILSSVSVAANDTKIISGLNTMIPAGSTLQGLQGTASAITVTISGIEVQ